jgi:hypothetical protein
MSKQLKTIPITSDDVSFIFNNDLTDFYFATHHCYCRRCKNNYDSTITDYTIKLNQLYDIELDGKCLDCQQTIRRYIETGDTEVTAKNAEAVWKTNKALKELKIKKTK